MRVLEWAETEYPDSALFLYFKSRILRLQVFPMTDQSLAAAAAADGFSFSFN